MVKSDGKTNTCHIKNADGTTYTSHADKKCEKTEDEIDMKGSGWTEAQCKAKCDGLVTCKGWFYHDGTHCHYFDGVKPVVEEGKSDPKNWYGG